MATQTPSKKLKLCSPEEALHAEAEAVATNLVGQLKIGNRKFAIPTRIVDRIVSALKEDGWTILKVDKGADMTSIEVDHAPPAPVPAENGA